MTTMAADSTRTPREQEESRSQLVGAGRAFAWLLIIGGALGVMSSAIITHDKEKLLADPGYRPPCSFSPIFSCGDIMESWQASFFGFPNPWIGWVTYSMLVAIGVSLLAGGRFARWWWVGLWAGTLFGAAFVTFLQYTSLYEVQKLCIWCMIAWVVTIALFWYTTVHNIKTGVFPVSEGVRKNVTEFHWVVPVLWYAAIFMAMYAKWGSKLWA
ncbi:vitamin K epoxide reductase family protein [Streptomyces sp. A7024]|uniref:Vitamin K epoxide reductase family protein n=1 Tax=Streptomyces coryli TaxID=1128680 RepID=A0A6G4TVP7_9ACTN|nr:vitamin K epoxide reductase family protein [Streptomyces coryli]NGN63071.1 vitamin K epoxide reductase family protein [Streptomyces coryli]